MKNIASALIVAAAVMVGTVACGSTKAAEKPADAPAADASKPADAPAADAKPADAPKAP